LQEAWEQVVVGLGDEVVAGAASVGRAGDVQIQANGGEVVAEPPDRVGQLGSHRIPPPGSKSWMIAAPG
jgi:hypothetical protein